MTARIVCTLKEAGVHQWIGCDIPEVMYLKNRHRHVFHFRCEKSVDHPDRNIEFIELKQKIRTYLIGVYFSEQFGLLNFGPMSCEMIAGELIEKFDLDACEVFEDGENGARVER